MNKLRCNPPVAVPLRLPLAADLKSDAALEESDQPCCVIFAARSSGRSCLARVRFFGVRAIREVVRAEFPYHIASQIWHRCYGTLYLIENSPWLADTPGHDEPCVSVKARDSLPPLHFLVSGQENYVEALATALEIRYLTFFDEDCDRIILVP